jgi:hypothetical protein
MVWDLTTWNSRALVSQNNSSGLSAIHGRTVRTWTTYRLAKNFERSIMQGHKNTISLPKLNSAYANGLASWPRRTAKGDRDRAPAYFSGRVVDGPAFWPGRSVDHIDGFFRLFKRICILKPEALLALMQMLPFMLYEALSFTPIKFIDPS